MGDSENKKLNELSAKFDKFYDDFNDFRVLLADNYLKKADCMTCKAVNGNSHNNLRNWIIGTYGALIAVIGIILGLRK